MHDLTYEGPVMVWMAAYAAAKHMPVRMGARLVYAFRELTERCSSPKYACRELWKPGHEGGWVDVVWAYRGDYGIFCRLDRGHGDDITLAQGGYWTGRPPVGAPLLEIPGPQVSVRITDVVRLEYTPSDIIRWLVSMEIRHEGRLVVPEDDPRGLAPLKRNWPNTAPEPDDFPPQQPDQEGGGYVF